MSTLLELVRRALSDPVAVGLRAWAAALPLVLLDAFTLPYLVLDDPDLGRAVTISAVAALGYAIAGLWLPLARLAMGHSTRPWIVSLVAWAVVGATWSAVLVVWSRIVDGRPLILGVVGVPAALFATASMSVVFASFVAIVLHAHRLSQIAAAAATDATHRYRATSEQMMAVQMGARLGLRTWLDDVLRPAVSTLIEDVQYRPIDAAARIDAVREQLVRGTSRRLHPRAVSLGVDAALASVLRAHDVTAGPVIELAIEIPPEITACFARCLDVLLVPQRCEPVSVVVDVVGDQVRLRITGIADSALASGPEVLARVQNLDGSVEMTAGGVDIRVPLHRVVPTDDLSRGTVRASDVDVPALVAIAVTLLTGIVIALIDGRVVSVLLGCLAAFAASSMLRMVPVDRVVVGPGYRRRVSGAAIVGATSCVISALITAAWWASSTARTGTDPAVIFWLANSVVICAVIIVVLLMRERIAAWQEQVAVAERMSVAASLAARVSIRDVDHFREKVASVLHSHVQARMIVAAGRMEDPRGPDKDGACRALRTIERSDLPHLQRIAAGGVGAAHSLSALSGAFAEVDVCMHVDEGFEPDRGGPVVEVVHEAIVNAVRHGGASRVRVKVRSQETDWLVTVADDGLGPGLKIDNGLGLSLVDAASGGRWELSVDSGGGAVLTAWVGK